MLSPTFLPPTHHSIPIPQLDLTRPSPSLSICTPPWSSHFNMFSKLVPLLSLLLVSVDALPMGARRGSGLNAEAIPFFPASRSRKLTAEENQMLLMEHGRPEMREHIDRQYREKQARGLNAAAPPFVPMQQRATGYDNYPPATHKVPDSASLSTHAPPYPDYPGANADSYAYGYFPVQHPGLRTYGYSAEQPSYAHGSAHPDANPPPRRSWYDNRE